MTRYPITACEPAKERPTDESPEMLMSRNRRRRPRRLVGCTLTAFLACSTLAGLLTAGLEPSATASVAGTISPVVGSGVSCGTIAPACGDGGPAGAAALDQPTDVVTDAAGDLYVADTFDNVVRFVPVASGTYYGQAMTAGDIYTIAGNLTTNGPGHGAYTADGVPATSAALDQPTGLALDTAGDLFIADFMNNRVRFVPAVSGTHYGQSMVADDIYTIAGTGAACAAATSPCGDGAAATQAQFFAPAGIGVDQAGDVFVADSRDNRVRFVPAVSGTYYGQTMTADDVYTIGGDGSSGPPYVASGVARAISFSDPAGIAVDQAGDVFVTVFGDNALRVIPAASSTLYGQAMLGGSAYTLAGSGASCNPATSVCGDGSTATASLLDEPVMVTLDPEGDIYLSDSLDQRVRFIPAVPGVFYGQAMVANDIYTIAGSGIACASATAACGDGGTATQSQFELAYAAAPDRNGDVYVADGGDNRIRFCTSGDKAATITSPGFASFTVGAQGVFTVSAGGTPAPALHLTGTLPQGLSFADHGDGSAAVTGAPIRAGTTTVTLTAVGAFGYSVTQSLTIAVAPPAQPSTSLPAQPSTSLPAQPPTSLPAQPSTSPGGGSSIRIPAIRIIGGRNRALDSRVTVRVSCMSSNCSGTAKITLTRIVTVHRAKRVRLHRQDVAIGLAAFSIPAGDNRNVTVHIDLFGRRLLAVAKHHRIAAVETVRVVGGRVVHRRVTLVGT
ncbi:MAG TPA: hypothetical protein VMU75_13560 [Acidimicrobiales bacterium]|nr:hypothetical protein [Acidimicrobiales bacterium]